jgi:hypothetical protein
MKSSNTTKVGQAAEMLARVENRKNLLLEEFYFIVLKILKILHYLYSHMLYSFNINSSL